MSSRRRGDGGDPPAKAGKPLLLVSSALVAQLCFILWANGLSHETGLLAGGRPGLRGRLRGLDRDRRTRGRSKGKRRREILARLGEPDAAREVHRPEDDIREDPDRGISETKEDAEKAPPSGSQMDQAEPSPNNVENKEEAPQQQKDQPINKDDGTKNNDKAPEIHEWQKPHNNEVWDKPDGWESFGFYRIRKHFKCSRYANDQTKPLPTLEDWDVFKNTYREVVDASAKFDDPVPPMEGYTLGEEGPPPFRAQHSKGKGRGLFATKDIQKGDTVHDGTNSDFVFPSGHSWRTFIFSLPRNKACDMIDWTWTQKLDGKWRIFSAMNISILLNEGNEDKDVNIMPESETSSLFHATKDIAKGGELLTDYEIYETVWNKVGL